MPKKRTRRRRKQVVWFRRTRTWAALLCLAVGVLFGLIWIAGQDQEPPPRTVPPRVATAPPVPDLTKQLVAETEAFLASTRIRDKLVRRDLTVVPYRYTVDGEPPSPALLQDLQVRLKHLSPHFSADLTEDGLLRIAEKERVRVLIFFVPPLLPVVEGPKVAIIMDDLGRGTHPAKVLLDIEQPVTFSILPGESHTRQVAAMAHAGKREVLLHVPMEPQGYPDVDPGGDALLVHFTEQEIVSRFDALLGQVPYAVGTNNHMGSRFTEDRQGMSAIMSVLHERGMFFVDSVTTGRSVGPEVAREQGVPVLKRDVFLDNVADVELIAIELRRLAKKAVRDGQAIGICHPYPETLQALQRELPKLAADGILVVPVSSLLPRRAAP